MALAPSVTGDGQVQSSGGDPRIYRVFSQSSGKLYQYVESKTTVVTKWPAITKAAGDAWLADLPWAEGEGRYVILDNPVLGSYIAESTIETVTTTKTEIAPS